MDPEKPKSDSPSEAESKRSPAERRVERLSSRDHERERDESSGPTRKAGDHSGSSDRSRSGSGGKAGAGSKSGSKAGPGATPDSESETRSTDGPPRLTERQRIEARERRRKGQRPRRRQASGSRPGGTSGESGGGNPLSRGVRATWVEVKRTGGFVWALILTALDRLGPAVRWLTAGLLELLAAAGAALSRLGRLIARAASHLGNALSAADRVLTPRRAWIVVVAAGIAALAASQFLDFRGVEVGQKAYDPILDITRAPRIDVQTPMDAHSVLLLAVSALAVAGLVGAAAGGRRAFGGLIALAGLATIAVTLLIDLPKGLDIAVAEISYSEVAAILLPGFWVQLSAGFVLAGGGLGLLALSGQRRRDRATDGSPERGRRERRRPADAGGLT
jgi:hypothetical protein